MTIDLLFRESDEEIFRQVGDIQFNPHKNPRFLHSQLENTGVLSRIGKILC